MKRLAFLLVAFALLVSACMPGLLQPQENPTPVSETDLQATAAILSQQTLQALPTNTVSPSDTPVIRTASPTITATLDATPTETANPALLTLTATLLAFTGTAETATGITTATGTPATEMPASTATAGTAQPLTYGTLPPNVAFGSLTLFNKSQVEVYVSLRCVTKDGNVTILEYPVNKSFRINAPAGRYTYTAWVGGRQFTGSFTLDKDNWKTITFFKDSINIKQN